MKSLPYTRIVSSRVYGLQFIVIIQKQESRTLVCSYTFYTNIFFHMTENLTKFTDLGLSEVTLAALRKKWFEHASPIQAACIPLLMTSSKDVIGQAQTGTGKTAAFGIPLIEKVNARKKYPQALVLTPTRELAIQVAEEITSFSGAKRIQTAVVYGGSSMSQQIRTLRAGAQIVVGTPGRVIDHIKRGTLKVDQLDFFVLDEADEMLNMGFLEDIEYVLQQTNENKQMLYFSATMPKEIKKIAEAYMKPGYEVIKTKTQQLTANNVDQIYFQVNDRDKVEALTRIIDIEQDMYAVIFCRTKLECDQLSDTLRARWYLVDSLHGDMDQRSRERVMKKFKKKQISLLVATDVAARGIDVDDLTHVINYHIPNDPESYTHRIGRTGRAGKQGVAITLITSREYRRLIVIERMTSSKIERGTLPEAHDVIQTRKQAALDAIVAKIEQEGRPLYTEMVELLIKEFPSKEVVAALIDIAFGKELIADNYRDINTTGSVDGSGKSRLFIAKGRKDGFWPREIVQMLKDEAGIDDQVIDDVKVLEEFSFATLPFADAETVLHVFNRKEGRSIVSKAREKWSDNRRGGRGNNRRRRTPRR